MASDSFLGLPWWQWALLVVACGIVAALVRRSAARSRHRAVTEELAQKADATHEGVGTRHEGGP